MIYLLISSIPYFFALILLYLSITKTKKGINFLTIFISIGFVFVSIFLLRFTLYSVFSFGALVNLAFIILVILMVMLYIVVAINAYSKFRAS